MSCNASEPYSASLRKSRAAKLPDMTKPDTDEEVTDRRTRRALRGGRGQRALKDRSRNLGGPAGFFPPSAGKNVVEEDITSWRLCRESDGLTVARKRGNSRGAKEPCRKYVLKLEVSAA